ncbi:hypothetical protein ACP4OV_017238 [Aristida adscensionis]
MNTASKQAYNKDNTSTKNPSTKELQEALQVHRG